MMKRLYIFIRPLVTAVETCPTSEDLSFRQAGQLLPVAFFEIFIELMSKKARLLAVPLQ